jgi:hypothetical protein
VSFARHLESVFIPNTASVWGAYNALLGQHTAYWSWLLRVTHYVHQSCLRLSLGQKNQVSFCTNISPILPGNTPTKTNSGASFFWMPCLGTRTPASQISSVWTNPLMVEGEISMRWDGGASVTALQNLSVPGDSRKMVGGGAFKLLWKVVSRTHGLQKSPNLKSD